MRKTPPTMKPMNSRWTAHHEVSASPVPHQVMLPRGHTHNGSNARSARVRNCALLPMAAACCARITQGDWPARLSYDDRPTTRDPAAQAAQKNRCRGCGMGTVTATTIPNEER